MFFRILKKDLVRKKTMNIILMLFVVLSAMFASSSVSNIISVFGGIDYYYEKAGMSDFVAITLNVNGENPADEIVKNAPSVTDYKKEKTLYYNSKNLKKGGKEYAKFENIGVITSTSEAKINFFNRNNEVITEIPKGHIYVGGFMADPEICPVGDTFTLEMGSVSLELTVDGYCKDVIFGSPFLGNPRILMNDEDFQKLLADEKVWSASGGSLYYINTDNMKELTKDMAGLTNALFAKESSVIRMTFMLDMITAAILMIVSICLILVAFAMLSFTIKFTLNEDFREIGVMKAVGLKNRSIRGLYMIKYLCISVVGAAIGFAASIPFGKMMLQSVSERIVIGNDAEILTGIVSSVAIVVIILLFCYFCTRGINRLSPIDAVRSGETGERYQKKSFLRLSKSILPGDLFLALNDVLSKPKQYLSMIVTFTVCLMLVMMLGITADTLMSDKLIFLFGTTKSDVYYTDNDKIMEIMGGGDEKTVSDAIESLEQKLADHGMPGKVHLEWNYQLPLEYKDNMCQVTMQQCKDTKASDYTYETGTAPKYENEIALTSQVLDELGAKVGDKILMEVGGEKKEYLVTATFVSLNQFGKTGRLHEDVPIKESTASSAFAFQIDFDDHPNEKVIAERIKQMKDFLGKKEIFNASEYVDDCTKSSQSVIAARNLVLIIAIIISMLIAVLMERSFISKETGEIALQKAIGFKSRSIVAEHTLRFVVVLVISMIFAGLLSYPFTKIIDDRIFGLMGASSGIKYTIKPLEIFVVYPLILGSATVFTAFLTSLYTKTIHADSMGNIE